MIEKRVDSLPATGDYGIIYIVEPGTVSYIWNGSEYYIHEQRPLQSQYPQGPVGIIGKNEFIAIDEVSIATESDSISIKKANDSLVFEVYGTATAFQVSVKGTTRDAGEEDTVIALIDSTGFNISQSATSKGIYTASVTGLNSVIFDVESVSGGSLSIKAALK